MAGAPHATRLPAEPATPRATGLRRLVPAPLRANADDHVERTRTDRTRKDWALDLLAIVASLVFGVAIHFMTIHQTDEPGPLLVTLDLILLPIGSVALLWRRRWPFAVAIAIAVMNCVAPSVALASLVATFAVGAYSRPAVALAGIGAMLVPSVIAPALWPTIGGTPDGQSTSYLADVLFGVALTAGVGAWGLFTGARRQLMASLQERADRAESEQQLRVEQGRQQERTRIAREMHDVLAHRMSLLSVHAGALEFRPDASPEEVGRAAGVIRATAHEALEELRTVIGVLRVADTTGAMAAPGDEAPLRPEPPQPTLEAVPHLVEEWRAAGARITLAIGSVGLEAIPTTVSRTAYRIVQESLTNAGKHATGAKVDVTLDGEPGESLTVSVSNSLGVLTPVAPIPGTGVGLVGLRERAELVGGAFAAGVDPDLRRFVVEARLPWSAA